jgi:hypothetical protein
MKGFLASTSTPRKKTNYAVRIKLSQISSSLAIQCRANCGETNYCLSYDLAVGPFYSACMSTAHKECTT